jgi:hypothetical protein
MSSSSAASTKPSVLARISETVFSRNERSLPRAWARSGSFQMAGFSSSRLTSSRRSTFVSKSKIPPERIEAALEVGDALAVEIEFHGSGEFEESGPNYNRSAGDQPEQARATDGVLSGAGR